MVERRYSPNNRSRPTSLKRNQPRNQRTRRSSLCEGNRLLPKDSARVRLKRNICQPKLLNAARVAKAEINPLCSAEIPQPAAQSSKSSSAVTVH